MIGDDYFTRSQGIGQDCNDNDPSFNASAAEIPSDGIDSNCNDKDDT